MLLEPINPSINHTAKLRACVMRQSRRAGEWLGSKEFSCCILTLLKCHKHGEKRHEECHRCHCLVVGSCIREVVVTCDCVNCPFIDIVPKHVEGCDECRNSEKECCGRNQRYQHRNEQFGCFRKVVELCQRCRSE